MIEIDWGNSNQANFTELSVAPEKRYIPAGLFYELAEVMTFKIFQWSPAEAAFPGVQLSKAHFPLSFCTEVESIETEML